MCLTWGINSSVWAKEITVHNEVYGIDSPGKGSLFAQAPTLVPPFQITWIDK